METPEGTPTMSSPEPPRSPLTPAEQARIRRERRQAKVREGAGSRLDKITSTQGLTYRTHENHKLPSRSPTPPAAPGATASLPLQTADHFPVQDPPDVDLSSPSSEAFRTPTREPQRPTGPQSEMEMMQQLLGGQQLPPEMENDPLLKLLSSLGGGPGGPGGMPNMGGMPPGLAGMMGPASTGAPVAQATTPASHDLIWKIVHGISALMLALWVLWNGTEKFDGSEKARENAVFGEDEGRPQLFWYFATMELVLQSTRFLIERGRPPQHSMLTTIAGFLPHPFGMYLTTVARYSAFLTMIMADASVLIFCLGMAAWWNS